MAGGDGKRGSGSSDVQYSIRRVAWLEQSQVLGVWIQTGSIDSTRIEKVEKQYHEADRPSNHEADRKHRNRKDKEPRKEQHSMSTN